MCAVNDTSSYKGELAEFESSLVNVAALSIPSCPFAAFGYYPQGGNTASLLPVILVTTGIGPVSAALCTQSFFEAVPSSFITRVLYVGSSGQSMFAGGFDPSLPNGAGCGLPTQRRIPIGSVCVAAAAVNQLCGRCVYNASVVPNECSEPECRFHNRTGSFGPCLFSGDRTLAKAVFAAGTQTPLPPPPATVSEGYAKFWSVFNGTGVTPPPPTGVVFGPDECVEVDQHIIDLGAPGDAQCRRYAAELLNSGATGAPSVTMANTPCFDAMEGVGFLQALNELGAAAPPFAIIRGGAGPHYYPLYQTSSGIWMQNVSFIPLQEYFALGGASHGYAVLTTNTILMRYLNTVSS